MPTQLGRGPLATCPLRSPSVLLALDHFPPRGFNSRSSDFFNSRLYSDVHLQTPRRTSSAGPEILNYPIAGLISANTRRPCVRNCGCRKLGKHGSARPLGRRRLVACGVCHRACGS
ncbi:hypothetical protein EVAR_53140_1 [Eumeta japonica]|uniref:Uncharacterized protein n=1 Tax=Eumeta variegata TaxID=151549 RepID=A0A4C1YG76_EUMVA|nr:hypothetical protein EVAR_53140_1 [Eumeta japonica]